MRFGINTLDRFNVAGKTVLCRVDINQSVDKNTGILGDITRIRACVPTIAELSDKGAKTVLLAHQGSDIEYHNFYTTEPHSRVLGELLNRKVDFIDDICGPAARQKIRNMAEGEILLLDNIRFISEEQTLFEMKLCLTHAQQAQTLLVQRLAPLADLYVCDAFAAAHRNQPSLCGFEQIMPSAMGRLFEREYSVISELIENPRRPCVFVLGGVKIVDAFLIMETLLKNKVADKILTGGLLSHILLAAIGKQIGSGTLDVICRLNYDDFFEKARVLYGKYFDRILLPQDLAYVDCGQRREVTLEEIPKDVTVADIGSMTAELYADIILSSGTVFANGPMGIFEDAETEFGTKTVWSALAATKACSITGGGDSIKAVMKYKLADSISYICTGGGALIRFIAGEELPVVKALQYATKKFGNKI